VSNSTQDGEVGEGRLGSGQTPDGLAVIWPLLGRHIAFHRRLVDVTKSVKAALLLSQAIYWTCHGRDIAANGGWFLKTIEQWEMETTLSFKEQATARAVLRELCLLQEQRIGIPAKLHFRIELDAICAALSQPLGLDGSLTTGADAASLAARLGPSLAFHRTLAAVAGSVHAGLMLSRVLYMTRLHGRRRLVPWIRSSEARWFNEIGLTRREQDTARRDLLRTGVWEEMLTGVPPQRVARIRVDLLLTLLAEQPPCACGTSPASSAVDRSTAPVQFAPKGESSLRESRRLVMRKAPIQTDRNRRHSSTESAALHISRSTSVSVQPQHVVMERADEGHNVGPRTLVFPDRLGPEERLAAARILVPVPDQAQALLDELSGRLQFAQPLNVGPIAYLRGLILRAKAGSFVPELGLEVAAIRRRRQEAATSRLARDEEDRRFAAERASPTYAAKMAARREDIRRTLALLRSSTGPGHES